MCRSGKFRWSLALTFLTAGGLAGMDGHADEASTPAYTTVVRFPGGALQPVSVALDGQEARRLAGTGGDPALALQDLPGVGRASPGATGLTIWGAAPGETAVLFDGIELPALYHFGGVRSTVGTELVGEIDTVPGAYSAEYGRAMGGLVRVKSRSEQEAGMHLSVDVSMLDMSLSLHAAGWRGLRFSAAARGSYLGRSYGRVIAPDTAALFPLPRYSDVQLEAVSTPTAGATVRGLLLVSLDSVRRDLDGIQPGLPPRVEKRRRRWWRAGISYTEQDDVNDLVATVYLGGDDTALDQRFGSAPALENSSATEFGLRARYRVHLIDELRLVMGVDSLVKRAQLKRAGSLTVPSREGDLILFGQPPGDDVNADIWSAAGGDLGAFLMAPLTPGAWKVEPGLRLDALPIEGNRALPPVGATPLVGYAHLVWAIDPRFSVVYEASPTLFLTAAGGVYHQPVDLADVSSVFGAPGLSPPRAVHAAVSTWKKLTDTTSAEVTGFFRHLDNLAVRSPLTTPLLGEALVASGRGRSFGMTAMVRRELAKGTLAWLTYSLSRSERWTPAGPVRLFDFDQTHVLTALASHQRGAWTVGGRMRYATGMPRTPAIGNFFDVRDGVYQPLFGMQNSTRLPPFFQIDARVDRTLISGALGVTLYLDVQNLIGRGQAEEKVYSRDFSTSRYLTGPPLVVFLGVKVAS